MYVILANKPGHFRTETGAEFEPVETYDYLFYGRRIAKYVIAKLEHEAKVRIIDESGSDTVNLVPSKFLPQFDTLDGARQELEQLARFGSMDIALVKV